MRVFDFVEPMRCNPGFGHQMHGLGAHLEFHVNCCWANQCGVQGLVTVEFGNGNMVLEFSRHRFVELMQQPKCRVAIQHGGYQNPEPIDVGYLRKAEVLCGHLLVNRIQGFFAACNANRHACRRKNAFHFLLHLLYQVTAATTGLGDGLCKNCVAPGSQVPKGKILEFSVGLV